LIFWGENYEHLKAEWRANLTALDRNYENIYLLLILYSQAAEQQIMVEL
jgi:hypothetical protein